ncbi:carboxypeptidase-like regulatory domain-containing protein [Flavobacterium sp.]|uniref:carboxypeptidase-like regulatory domain-containing protein n=1 Tax=Flavobacterium sp. TaxID=239 RepID=UPI0026322635|nr:carboxypeptidase-like regulatory domain-containing protein [Flavobacterium sp.]MDD3003624.1 carboxypeptidase-like regulatory domain-containing protein [Flavobacterium sp.]
MLKKILFIFTFLCSIVGFSQNKIATIVDAVSGETIPYANIKIGNDQQIISNSEGKFSIGSSHDNPSTTLHISFMGYEPQQLTLGTLENQKFVIKLTPGIYQLDNVDVTNKKEDVASIMAKVKANLKENYFAPTSPISSTIFIRDQNIFKAKQFNLEVEKSTGFSKNKLKEVNAEIKSYAYRMTQNPPREFKDFLGVYSSSLTKKEDKMVNTSKLKILKATRIKDENRSVSMDDLEKTASNLFLKHLDTTKFYRVKSGWFGSRDTISFSKEFNKNRKSTKEKKVVPKNVIGAKSTIVSIQTSTNPVYGMKTDFIRQTDWYKYTLDGAIFTNDYKLVYVIKFQPKKGKAKYEGTLYVSENDYAVVKATYKLAKGKTLGGINLKWVLGVKVFENVSSGTLIYKENPDTKKYYLQYANIEEGQYFYLNRPLKFIELTDEEKDILALEIKAEGDILDKMEYLNLGQKELSVSEFEQLNEPDFKYIKLNKYDPKIWKEFTTLEPVEEMKQFSINEN